jgi:sec-independent protein translocase protein TatA
MGRIGLPELIVIFVILLLLFGATRLPQIAKSIGESIKEFKKGIAGKKEGDEEEKKE